MQLDRKDLTSCTGLGGNLWLFFFSTPSRALKNTGELCEGS